MSSKNYHTYEEVQEILKQIAKEEFEDDLKCERCKRLFDPNEELMYFVSASEGEIEEEKGFFLCFECRDQKQVLMEQMI